MSIDCFHFFYGIMVSGENMITSLTNDMVKSLSKLNEKKYRDETGLFLVEGEHLVLEAKKYGAIETIISTDSEGIIVSPAVMKKISKTESVVKILGVCKKVNKSELCDRVLMLDNIQDPGNMGTLIRSAISFGFMTIVLGEGCCDIYSPKVIRSTQGAIFQINVLYKNILTFIDELTDYKIYGTSLINGIPLKKIKKEEKMAIILGNEGQGVKKEILEKNQNIFIEMNNMESLNVGVAGSIIMYELSMGV